MVQVKYNMEIVSTHGSWEELKKRLRLEYPQLTEQDLQHNAGEEEEMLRMVEYKLQKTREEMSVILNSWKADKK